MPLLSMILTILTYFLSRKSGASKGKAALLAAGVGLASYATIEPTNENALWGDKVGEFFGYSREQGASLGASVNSEDAIGSATRASNGAAYASAAAATVGSLAENATKIGAGVAIGTQSGNIMSWVKEHPFLTAAMVIGGIYVLRS